MLLSVYVCVFVYVDMDVFAHVDMNACRLARPTTATVLLLDVLPGDEPAVTEPVSRQSRTDDVLLPVRVVTCTGSRGGLGSARSL